MIHRINKNQRESCRFSLLAFLLATVACGILAGWGGSNAIEKCKRQRAIEHIYESGSCIVFCEGITLGQGCAVSVPLLEVDTGWNVSTVALGVVDCPGDDRILSDLAQLHEVECVNLYGPRFTNMGLRHLTELSNLRYLDLSHTSITAAGLSRFDQFRELERLTFAGIGDPTLEGIGLLTNLQHLQITSSPEITDAGLRHLKPLSCLHSLDLYRTPIHGSGLRYLTSLPALRTLRLNGTEVNDVAVHYLQQMPRLRCLDISDTHISTAGVTSLRRKLGGCKIVCEGRADKRDKGR
jgi:hypothetical protein